MSKITKVINGFVIPALVVIVVLLLLPLDMSFWVKNNYSKLLSHLGQVHNINLKLVKFERGWFASSALIQVTLPPTNKNNLPLQFMLNQRILNGPYLVGKMGDKKRIYLAKGLIYNASEKPYFIFHSSTLIRFNNVNETILHANQIHFITGQQQISLQNLNFKVKYNPSARQLISNATAKSMTISEQKNNLITLNNLALHNELQQKNSLWYGQRSLEADKLIYYLSPHQQPIQIERMALQTQQTTTNGTTDLTLNGHAYKAKSNLFDIVPLNIKLSLTQMNTTALGTLVTTVLNLNHSGTVDTAFLHQIYSPFLNVLSQGALLSLEQLAFGTKEGTVTVHGELQFFKRNQVTDLKNIMVSAKGKTEISMPLTWLKIQLSHLYQKKKVEIEGQDLTPDQVADQQIQYWLTNKKLISDGPNVNLKLIYDGGGLLINDMPSSYIPPQQ